jgi:hypothetical protein
VPVVHRLKVHERDNMLILVNHARFPAPGGDVAEHTRTWTSQSCHATYCRPVNRSLLAPVKGGSQSMNTVYSCLQAHGWRGFATYQPASRWWAFQGIETLIAVAFVIVRRRDA